MTSGKINKYLPILLITMTLPLIVLAFQQRVQYSSNAAGNTFYIDCNAGSDSNNGTTQTTAWKSLTKINGAGAGDTVSLKKGCNWDGGVVISTSGVTVNTYGTGAAPTIQNGNGPHVIDLQGSNITLDGLAVHNAPRAGIESAEGTSSNIIKNVEMYNVGFGVELFGSKHKVLNSYAHDLHMVNNTQGGDDDYGAVGYNLIGHDMEVAYSRCINCTAPSYDYGYDGGFVEIWKYGDNTNVHHNYAENTRGFFELGSDSASDHANNIKVHHNVIYNTWITLVAHSGNNFSISVNNMQFDNNTIVQNGGNDGQIWFPGVTPEKLLMRNNIFSLSGGNMGSDTNFTHTNNLYFGANSLGGAGEKTGDPQFVNAGAKDFRLKAGSTAIDAGANLGYTSDYDNKTIPAGGAPDMGAFEYGATGGTAPTNAIVPTEGAAPTEIPEIITPTLFCLGPCVPTGEPDQENGPQPTQIADNPGDGTGGPNQNPGGGNGRGNGGFFSMIFAFFIQLLTMFLQLLGGGRQ